MPRKKIYHLATCHHSTEDGVNPSDHQLKKEMVRTNFLSTKVLAFAVLECGMHLPCGLCRLEPNVLGRKLTSRDRRERRQKAQHVLWPYQGVEHGTARGTAKGLWTERQHGDPIQSESPLRRPQFVSRKISQAAAATYRGDPFRLDLLNVGARTDWSSANDVVRALHLMGTADRPADFVVASGQLHSVRTMLDVAFGHVGLDWKSLVRPQSDVEEPTLVGNATLLETTLGWKRRQSFSDMIKQMVDADIALRDIAHDRR